MELVLMRLVDSLVSTYEMLRLSIVAYLEVAELGELLAAFIKLARKGLDLLMYDLMRSYVSTLRESLAADVTIVRSLASVTALVCLVYKFRTGPA
jgi:hypothetical protein